MGNCMSDPVDKLTVRGILQPQEFVELLRFRNAETTVYLAKQARQVREKKLGNKVTLWGRIPLSNHCRFDCNFCGIRRSNHFANRYRMSNEQVLAYCHEAYQKGIKHFILESGVDLGISEEKLAELIRQIKTDFSDSKVLLDLGEHTTNAYQAWQEAGAYGYMMTQVTAEEKLFRKLHPANISLLKRKDHLWRLRDMGYRVGAGFMVGSPYQTIENVVTDLMFLKQYGPEIVQVSAFLPAQNTEYAKERGGNGEMVLYLMGILRLMLPGSMILADLTLDQTLTEGRKQSLNYGTNAIISNLCGDDILQNYEVYQPKAGKKIEADERLFAQLEEAGYEMTK